MSGPGAREIAQEGTLNGEFVLFEGYDEEGSSVNDTSAKRLLAFNGNTWTEYTGPAPSGRGQAWMVACWSAVILQVAF